MAACVCTFVEFVCSYILQSQFRFFLACELVGSTQGKVECVYDMAGAIISMFSQYVDDRCWFFSPWCLESMGRDYFTFEKRYLLVLSQVIILAFKACIVLLAYIYYLGFI